jgi:hypothetical protein
LTVVIEAWESLPNAIREAVLTLMRSASEVG